MDGDEEMDQARYGSVLLPYDGSAHARAAFRPAAEIASRAGARLHLARALRRGPDRMVAIQPTPRHTPEGGVDAEEAAYQADLSAVRRELETGWDVEVSARLLRDDRPPRALERYAREIGADLVVAATRSRSLPGRALLGSTTTYLLHTLACPTLLIPADDPEPDLRETPMQGDVDRVVAAVEEPDARGRAVVAQAVTLAHLFDAGISLVHLALDAPVLPPSSVSALPVPGRWSPPEGPEARREADRRLAEWARRLAEAGRAASPRLDRCGGVASLLDFVRDSGADLLVMGRRDEGVAARLAFGEPSDRVHRRLRSCGLLVVPHGPCRESDAPSTVPG